MEQVTVRREVAAPPEATFARYADIPSWNRWARLGRVTVSRPGGPSGRDVRTVTTLWIRVDEEITDVRPPRLVRYRLLRGMPLRNHHGIVRFDPCGAGTLVTWSCQFDPPGGLGRPLRGLVRLVFTRALAGLAAELANEAGGSTVAAT
ncbi:MAG: SRPBCC family protein [Actinomycetales bacterium]|jgi:uncharacterized membrane protein|nr:SRPBCC family protein [Actinomycetales bacterium]